MTTRATRGLIVSSAVSGAASSVVTQLGIVLAEEIQVGRAGNVALAVTVATALVLLTWSVVPRLVDRLSRSSPRRVAVAGVLGSGAWAGAVLWAVATSSPVKITLVTLAGVALAGAGMAAGRRRRSPPPPAVLASPLVDGGNGSAAGPTPDRGPRAGVSVLIVLASVAVVAGIALVSTGDPTPSAPPETADMSREKAGGPPGGTERDGGPGRTTGTTAPTTQGCTAAAAREAIRDALNEQLDEVVVRFFDEVGVAEIGCPDPHDFGPHLHGTPSNGTWDLRFTGGRSGDRLLVGTPGGEMVLVPEPFRAYVLRQLDTQPVVQLSRVEVAGTTTFLFGLPDGRCTAVYQYKDSDPLAFDPPSLAVVLTGLMVSEGQWGKATEADVPGHDFVRQIDVVFNGKAGPGSRVTVGVTKAESVEVSSDLTTVRDATACPTGLTLESLDGASP